ncbi:MAG: HEAT repeat domain-containing protein [Acidobacteriota bacterium]
MKCEEAKPLLADYWSQTLGETEELSLEAHLAGCEACQAAVTELGTLWKSLALLPADEPGSGLRMRFYETLGAYRQGVESVPRGQWRQKLAGWWPQKPAWQVAIAASLMVVGVGAGYGLKPGQPRQEMAELRQEVSDMRQMVALSLMQQQSASERLRGVGWAYRSEPSDTEVLSALVAAVNHDPSVNVRLAAVDALHAFAASPVTRKAVVEALPGQNTPMVQVALIDLLVDLKQREAKPELRTLAASMDVNDGVKERALWALEKLQ